MKPNAPYWPVIIFSAIVKFALPFILQSPVYELQRDEFLYFQQGRHLDFGFLENPPLISFLAKISSLFGEREWLLKCWPALFGALTLVITCLLTAEFGGKKFSQLVAALCIITGAYLRVHFLFQPNILDIFFWTLSIYLLVRFINTGESRFLYGLALSLALGWWGKYSIVFIIASIIIALLFSKYRKLYLQRRIYLAFLMALLIILPNVWWQYQHNWALLHHMQELQETQLKYLDPSNFLKDQLLMLLPVCYIWIAGFIWLIKHPRFKVLSFIYIAVIIFLLIGKGKSYYSLGIYPMLFAAGAVAWESVSSFKRWMRPSLIILILTLSLPFIPLLLPVWAPDKLADFYSRHKIGKTGLLKWEDLRDHSLPQDFADMLGWKEMTLKTKRFFYSLPDSVKTSTLIYCRNYGQAGSLKFYGHDDYFSTRVFSDNGSFLLWIPERLWFKHLLFVGRNIPGKDDEVFQHFESASIVDSVTYPHSRQVGDKIIFFKNADTSAAKIARAGLNEMKEQFKRSATSPLFFH